MYENAYRDVRLMWYEVLYKKTIWIFIYWKKNTVKKEKSNWKKVFGWQKSRKLLL